MTNTNLTRVTRTKSGDVNWASVRGDRRHELAKKTGEARAWAQLQLELGRILLAQLQKFNGKVASKRLATAIQDRIKETNLRERARVTWFVDRFGRQLYIEVSMTPGERKRYFMGLTFAKGEQVDAREIRKRHFAWYDAAAERLQHIREHLDTYSGRQAVLQRQHTIDKLREQLAREEADLRSLLGPVELEPLEF